MNLNQPLHWHKVSKNSLASLKHPDYAVSRCLPAEQTVRRWLIFVILVRAVDVKVAKELDGNAPVVPLHIFLHDELGQRVGVQGLRLIGLNKGGVVRAVDGGRRGDLDGDATLLAGRDEANRGDDVLLQERIPIPAGRAADRAEVDYPLNAVEVGLAVAPLMAHRTRQSLHHVLAYEATMSGNQNSHCALSSTQTS